MDCDLMCMGGWGRQPYLADVIIQGPCWACQLPSPSLLWPLTHQPTHPSKCTTIPSNYVVVLLDIKVSHSKSGPVDVGLCQYAVDQVVCVVCVFYAAVTESSE